MGMGFFYGGGFEVIFMLMFFAVFGVIIFTIIRGVGEWNKNNHSPRLTVEAEVVSKRISVHHHHDANNIAMDHSSTTYYVTFQVESGDRLELHVSGGEYGMVVEGDKGRLTFQGTRYLGFERTM